MLVLEWKGGAFIEKVNSRCFCWFPAAILVDSFCPPNCPPVWRLHTKLYKGAWNVSATNSETVSHKDLRFGQIVYNIVFYNISFSWLLPLDAFKCIFLCRVYCVTVKTKNGDRLCLNRQKRCLCNSKVLSSSFFWVSSHWYLILYFVFRIPFPWFRIPCFSANLIIDIMWRQQHSTSTETKLQARTSS